MKIIYSINPLDTKIEIDELDRCKMRFKILEEEITDKLYSAHYHLKEGDIDRVKEELDPSYYLSDKDGERSQLEQHVDEMLEYYVAELSLSHCGDCTCVPASCGKCHAESLLGIDTIEGLGKHSAYKVDSAIKEHGTLEGAIIALENYSPVRTPEWKKWLQLDFDSHMPRWKNEAAHAAEWLRKYRDDHFGSHTKSVDN